MVNVLKIRKKLKFILKFSLDYIFETPKIAISLIFSKKLIINKHY